ncbi:MAG TPA: hypothetical protein VM938_16505 [Acidimicrobiales bacterium]|nr:hypothetical protein [Acidimicrobiales bacterium]
MVVVGEDEDVVELVLEAVCRGPLVVVVLASDDEVVDDGGDVVELVVVEVSPARGTAGVGEPHAVPANNAASVAAVNVGLRRQRRVKLMAERYVFGPGSTGWCREFPVRRR